MRDGWTETTLGAVLSIQSGFAFSTNDWAAEGYPVIKINNVRDGKVSTESCSYISDPIPHGAEKFLLERGDLLITLTGEIGATGVVDQTFPMYLNQRVGKVRIQEESKALLSYVAVLFNFPSVRAEMWSLGKGNAQLNISPKSIQEMLVLLPPLAEQKRIVDVVSSVNAYIDALQQQADSARSARNAVLHELLYAGGDDWTETTVSTLLSRSIGGVWGTEPGTDQEEVTVVRSTEFTKSGILNFATGVPRSIKSSQLSSRALTEGDILLEKSGGGPEQPVGRVVYVQSEIPPRFVCSNFIQLLTPIHQKVSPKFLFLVMWLWHFENKTLEYQAQTTGIRNLRTPDYLEQFIALPPLGEQKRIVEIVSSMDDVIQSTEQAVTDAKNLRSGLLSDLLSGEHEIPASYDSHLGAA